MPTFRNFVNSVYDPTAAKLQFTTHEELVYYLAEKYPDEDIKWRIWYDSERTVIGDSQGIPTQEYLVRHTIGILGSVSDVPELLSRRRVVCAANRTYYVDADGERKSLVIAGARHCDGVMAPVLKFVREHSMQPDETLKQQQGFIDQYGNFMTREEAYLLARSNKQMIVDAGKWPRERLYSEHLY